MIRRTVSFLMILAAGNVAIAQDPLPLPEEQWVYFEFGAKLSSGVNRPGMKKSYDHYSNTVVHKPGSYYGGGLQATVGFNWLSLSAEGSYALANYDLDYQTGYSQKTGGKSSRGDYRMGIQKMEFAFYPALKIGSKKRFSVHAGFYMYSETSKMASGDYSYSSSWYDPTIVGPGPGPHYATVNENLHFENSKLGASSGGGALTGMTYVIPFKNRTALSVELRIKAYGVALGLHEEAIRSTDLGIGIGYIFWTNKRAEQPITDLQ